MSTKAGYASIPSAVAMPLDGTNMMVDIVAPADMAEGYTFEASYVDRKFQITVVSVSESTCQVAKGQFHSPQCCFI